MMAIVDVFEPMRADARVGQLANLLTDADGPVVAAGLWGSSAPILSGMLAERLGRPLLLVTAHTDETDNNLDDLKMATGIAPEHLPFLDQLPGEETTDDELISERLRLCVLLSDYNAARMKPCRPPVIVAGVQALMQPVPSPDVIENRSLKLEVGQAITPAELVDWLDRQTFTRCDQVELPGDFAQRGGIVDVFCNAHSDPIRIEYFGDEIESIRYFDAGTKRSSHELHTVRLPSRAVLKPTSQDGSETTGFLSFLPADTIIALHEPADIQELGRSYWQRLGERVGTVPVEAIFRRSNDFTQLYLQRFAGGIENGIDFTVAGLPPFEAKTGEALETLVNFSRDYDVVVLCDNRPELQRFEQLLGEMPHTPSRVRAEVGIIHNGFVWERTAFIPHHELFHRYRQRRTLRKVQPARPIDSFFDLDAGDYVVHALHGIGRFRGLKTLDRVGTSDEYLAIEFAGDAVVHVPVSQIHVVQKYIGSFRGKPKLSKVGSLGWKRTKQRVAEAVTDLASDLLAIQAQRETRVGIAYPGDTLWQREFEGSFIYTETEDQLRALSEMKNDMFKPRPMDRLLCGDVGFGKTELAVRAAFKAIEYGKQVAVLVPTTVLAEQHYQTFSERMADYPFKIEVLSRFRSKAEQNRILEATRGGRVDLLIGTHRLLSKDVRFADLGLVVIDEEQRFGVEAKERLKRLRAAVDVLTLSATPIPRTLHMAMLGIREISSLATPPLDRRAIVTQVRLWDEDLLRTAILREMSRDGQIYFVHNFVRDIHTIANRIRTIVPEARVVVGHGQMKGPELEDVMLKFMHHEADILVSTNIIESGIDIPSTNTIFINRAERFGLADLHQLRGRVGRSKNRAYCYLLLSPKHPLKDQAASRLKAIEQYSQLGAGFQIAMRDLEIRGAGNILGSEQSGNIEAVGYEMYCQLLEQAVRKMRNEPADIWRPVNLDLGLVASIPRAYIRSERQRMEVYKRLAAARAPADTDVLRDDLRDAFGPLPKDVETLLTLAEIRVLSQPWGIRSIVLDPPDVIFAIDDLDAGQVLFSEGPGSPRLPDPKTVHWRLPKRYLEQPTLLTVLRKQLSRESSFAKHPALNN